MAHILVIEGNSEALTPRGPDGRLQGAAENYARKLSQFDNRFSFDVCRPHFHDFDLNALQMEAYDGFAFTGSAVPWSASDAAAAPARAVMTAALDTGRPVIGSCYGMQLAIAVLGGVARANPKGAEIGIAAGIELNKAGQAHPAFAGKPASFSALCMHRDVIMDLPDKAVLLAGNAHTSIQALAIETSEICFWGVQYHPELEFGDIASYLRQTEGNGFDKTATLAQYIAYEGLSADEAAADFDALQTPRETMPSDYEYLIKKYRLDETITDRSLHETELRNWMSLVLSRAK